MWKRKLYRRESSPACILVTLWLCPLTGMAILIEIGFFIGVHQVRFCIFFLAIAILTLIMTLQRVEWVRLAKQNYKSKKNILIPRRRNLPRIPTVHHSCYTLVIP